MCRALVVCPTFGGLGGMEQVSLALLRHFQDHHQLKLSLFFKCIHPQSPTTLQDLFQPHECIQMPKSWIGLALLRAIQAADIVHIQNMCLASVALCWLLKKPFVVTIHHQGRDRWRSPLWRACLGLPDWRIYISRFIQSIWEPQALDNRHCILHSVGLLPPQMPFDLAAKKGFLMIGRLIEGKGLKTLLPAYQQAGVDPEKWPLTLIGTGPLGDWVRHYIAEHQLVGVRLLGFVPEASKWAYIRQAAWILAPTEVPEDFGLTPLEGRYGATPSIVSSTGGLPAAAGPQAILCESGSIESLKQALLQAAHMDPNLYEQRCRLLTQTFEDYTQPFDAYERIYTQLLAHPHI